jgi:hypothetical protein
MDEARITHTYVPDGTEIKIVLTTITGSGLWHATACYDGVHDDAVIEEASAERELDALFMLAGRLASEAYT